MDWQGALRARLVGATAVTAIVGQKVYWVDRPQAASLPAITLQTVVGNRSQNMQGFDGIERSIVQVDAWGKDSVQLQLLVDAIIAALVPENTGNGHYFARSFIDSIRDLGERVETAFIYRASIDLITHHNTTA